MNGVDLSAVVESVNDLLAHCPRVDIGDRISAG
jgi:hypothetical protein